MELLDRYLQAVRKYLPRKRQNDILAELRANMESQLEDKESALGRPLTQGETEDWLRAMGSPLLVASRYQPQQYLIGPTLYPVYLYVLRVTLSMAIMVYTIVSAVVLALNSPGAGSVAAAIQRVPGILVTVAAWVTLVFAALEFIAARYPEVNVKISGVPGGKWSPSSLPPLEKDEDPFSKPRSYPYAVAEVVFGFIFLVWLVLIPSYPFLLLGPGMVFLTAGPFELAPVWWAFFWWIVALNVLQLAWRSINLLRGAWERRSKAENIVVKAFGLIPIGILLTTKGSAYVALKNPAVDRAHYGATLDSINKSIHTAFAVICVIVVLQLAWNIGRMLLQGYEERAATQ
jgi:hypothetical protein